MGHRDRASGNFAASTVVNRMVRIRTHTLSVRLPNGRVERARSFGLKGLHVFCGDDDVGSQSIELALHEKGLVREAVHTTSWGRSADLETFTMPTDAGYVVHQVPLVGGRDTQRFFLVNPRGAVPVLYRDGATHVVTADILRDLERWFPSHRRPQTFADEAWERLLLLSSQPQIQIAVWLLSVAYRGGQRGLFNNNPVTLGSAAGWEGRVLTKAETVRLRGLERTFRPFCARWEPADSGSGVVGKTAGSTPNKSGGEDVEGVWNFSDVVTSDEMEGSDTDDSIGRVDEDADGDAHEEADEDTEKDDFATVHDEEVFAAAHDKGAWFPGSSAHDAWRGRQVSRKELRANLLVLESALVELEQGLSARSSTQQQQRWLCGDGAHGFSLADVAWGPIVRRLDDCGYHQVLSRKFPHVALWYAALRARSSWRSVVEEPLKWRSTTARLRSGFLNFFGTGITALSSSEKPQTSIIAVLLVYAVLLVFVVWLQTMSVEHAVTVVAGIAATGVVVYVVAP